jgi:acetyl esterase/lipase
VDDNIVTGMPAVPLIALVLGLLQGPVGTIALWPEGVPGARPGGGDERVVKDRVSNVHAPTLTYFPAPGDAGSKPAIVVCPGGGYQVLAFDHEGIQIAKRLNAMGVSAFILKYRLVEYGHPAPLQDVLRAVRTVRSRAAEFGVAPGRIGVLGFSAGGHLAATAATLFDAPEGRTGAPIDAVSARPDFAVLIYPVITMKGPFAHAGSRRNLLGEQAPADRIDRLSPELQVTKNTPPLFLVHTAEDKGVPLENSLQLFQAVRAAGGSAELHLYEKGPHGFGLGAGLGPAAAWPASLETWMRAHGWIGGAPAARAGTERGRTAAPRFTRGRNGAGGERLRRTGRLGEVLTPQHE